MAVDGIDGETKKRAHRCTWEKRVSKCHPFHPKHSLSVIPLQEPLAYMLENGISQTPWTPQDLRTWAAHVKHRRTLRTPAAICSPCVSTGLRSSTFWSTTKWPKLEHPWPRLGTAEEYYEGQMKGERRAYGWIMDQNRNIGETMADQSLLYLIMVSI